MATNSILILGLARSGTTSLGKGLAHQGVGEFVGEPWRSNNPKYRENSSSIFFDYIKEAINIVLKSIITHVPYAYDRPTPLDFYKYLISIFGIENTILITRKNLDEHVDSRMHLRYKSLLKDKYKPLEEAGKSYINKHAAHVPYRSSFTPKSFLQNRKERQMVIDYTIQERKVMFELSKLYNKDIVWYEDLYGNDRDLSLKIIKSWAFKDFEIDCIQLNEYLDPKYKYNKSNFDKLI